MDGLHVIFGYGPVGKALASELVRAGERVRVVTRGSRSIDGAEGVSADATDTKAAARAAAGASVVYNCTNAPYHRWPELLPPLYRGIRQAAVVNQARLVYTDNLYAYGPTDGPMHEGMPDVATGRKGALRVTLAREAIEAGGTVVRASDFIGPKVDNSILGGRALRALVAGKPIDLIGDPGVPHSLTYIPDLAKALVIVGRNPETVGKILLCPNAPAESMRSTLRYAAEAVGRPLRIRRLPNTALVALGWFNPVMRELRETLYQFERPFIADGSLFANRYGLVATPLAESMRASVQSWTPGS